MTTNVCFKGMGMKSKKHPVPSRAKQVEFCPGNADVLVGIWHIKQTSHFTHKKTPHAGAERGVLA
jgi:hypothetical protein